MAVHVQLPPSIASLAPDELRTFVATAVAEARLQHVSRHLAVSATSKDNEDRATSDDQLSNTLQHDVSYLLLPAVHTHTREWFE